MDAVYRSQQMLHSVADLGQKMARVPIGRERFDDLGTEFPSSVLGQATATGAMVAVGLEAPRMLRSDNIA
jgi:hypothetical protein